MYEYEGSRVTKGLFVNERACESAKNAANEPYAVSPTTTLLSSRRMRLKKSLQNSAMRSRWVTHTLSSPRA